MSDQFGRKASLIVADGAKGLDLSELRLRFQIRQSDIQTPNTAAIRVYNLSDETARKVQTEFARVVLQAGYEDGGNYGVIFDGTIKQVRRGRENSTDTYLDILAADGDLGYNFGVVNASLAAGSTAQDRLASAAKAMSMPVGYAPDLPPAALARGKVLFGMGRDYITDAAGTIGATWSIQNGQIEILPLQGYKPGEAVVLNSATGMVGLPEQTEGGINVTCLINPRIRTGGLVQIDQRSIQRAFISDGKILRSPGRNDDLISSLQALPKITDDGFYRVYVVEHDGDTRGSQWHSRLVCLAVDRTAPVSRAVSAQ